MEKISRSRGQETSLSKGGRPPLWGQAFMETSTCRNGFPKSSHRGSLSWTSGRLSPRSMVKAKPTAGPSLGRAQSEQHPGLGETDLVIISIPDLQPAPPTPPPHPRFEGETLFHTFSSQGGHGPWGPDPSLPLVPQWLSTGCLTSWRPPMLPGASRCPITSAPST